MKISRSDQDYLYVLIRRHILDNSMYIQYRRDERGNIYWVGFNDAFLGISLSRVRWWDDINMNYVTDKFTNTELELSHRIQNKLFDLICDIMVEKVGYSVKKPTFQSKHVKLLNKLGWEE